MKYGYNAKMAFINSLQSEKISENLNVILQNTEAQDDFWNLCKSYAEIGLNAPKYRTPGTCDVQGVFQYADIDTAKDNTVEFIQKYNIDDVDEFFDLVEKILCMGLNDVVVSASPGGILVSDKEQSSYIKPFVNMLDHQVMFAEESWGNFKVIDIDKESMTIKVTLNAGHRMNYHSHQHRDEVWTVIAGKGKTIVDGMEQNVKAGDVITMSAGCRHTVIAETELKLIEVQLGKEIDVNDKQKFELEY